MVAIIFISGIYSKSNIPDYTIEGIKKNVYRVLKNPFSV